MKTINKLLIKFTLFLILFFTSNTLQAQDFWGSYCDFITDKSYEGQKFRYTGSVRIEFDDPDATAGLWLRIDVPNNNGFFENMEDRPISAKEWKEFSIEGTIDKGYTQISFGILFAYNGKFFLDNINLEVLSKDNQWISIYKTGFENGIENWKQGIGKGTSGINEFVKSEINNNAKSGQNCLAITFKSTN
jgi:hypothetical protein